MTLARMWERQLFSASGVALLVPYTVLAAVVIVAPGGAPGGLAAVGRVVSEPGGRK